MRASTASFVQLILPSVQVFYRYLTAVIHIYIYIVLSLISQIPSLQLPGLCDPAASSAGLTGDGAESSGSDDLLDAFLEEAEQKVA